MKSVLFLVPNQLGGVRDYADVLGNRLTKKGLNVEICPVSKNSINLIYNKLIQVDCVVLQYSGYGFQSKGAPLWLLRYLNGNRSKINKFIVYAHELYADGPILSTAFWLRPLQQYIVLKLVKMSDFWLTNREESARWLKHRGKTQRGMKLQVFSNVGESKERDFALVKKKIIAVFGSAELRYKAYRSAGDILLDWAEQNGYIIYDIGTPISGVELSRLFLSKTIVKCGRLSEEKVSQVLSQAMIGVIYYPVEFVGKSGVFAAYAGHGVAPLLISKQYEDCEGLCKGSSFITLADLDSAEKSKYRKVGKNAARWYAGHNIEKHTEKMMDLINGW